MTTLDTIEAGTEAAAVTDLLARVGAAWAANDADASAELYTPDAAVATVASGV